MKGESAVEIAAFARVMRHHAVTVAPVTRKTLVDTCGTGGDGTQTFNISTASAFVAAGAGVPVVKHREPERQQHLRIGRCALHAWREPCC